ncbi:AI-2E family transporter [Paenibacillus sp. J31TS4]|uniref:AI-2E family transporter n=1 Tax=Paenibacillus sp. J31TS4 TaxID=2807195 RepID=UPI001B1F353A|nr:AI-2E family transporter [Paenibacillus sp. J31TS4]GIP40179.1 AI-2E family transporter [Paenibacillus sp. J31TS4]
MKIYEVFQKKDVRRFAVLAVFCLLLFYMRSMLNIILLTFLFTFLMDRAHGFTTRALNRVFPIGPKIVLSLLYLLLTALLIVGGVKMVPALIYQIRQLIKLVEYSYNVPKDNELVAYLLTFLNKLDIQGVVNLGLDFLMKLSNLGLNLFLALLLSLFFLLGKANVVRFTAQFRQSKLAWLFTELEYFSTKFVHTFGKVIETQLIIALINTVLTIFSLWLMGFPNLIGLSLLVFILGLIPVAGVFISLIPLSVIAFSIGGLPYIIYLLITITVIHAVEAYVLNPRLMAAKTHLPIFYTFIVLLFSEHFFGIWGLIVGIPTFVFLLDILDVQKLGQPQGREPLPASEETSV